MRGVVRRDEESNRYPSQAAAVAEALLGDPVVVAAAEDQGDPVVVAAACGLGDLAVVAAAARAANRMH